MSVLRNRLRLKFAGLATYSLSYIVNMSVTLTPGQLRQVRETIETLTAIAAPGSSRGNSSTAFPTGTRRTPVTTTSNSLQRETNNNLVSASRLSADPQIGETATPAAISHGDVSDDSASSSSNVREG